MNLRIRTAHGYLSFQPDGRLEYRAQAGAWETLDVEGLVFLTPVPGPSPTPADPPTPPPVEAGPPPTATPAYVAVVKAQLVAEGRDLSGPCGAFAITKRVAWMLRGLGIGLVSKPSGNNCDGYSIDYLCWQNGDGVDILGDAGGENKAQWALKPSEFTGQNRWRAPVAP